MTHWTESQLNEYEKIGERMKAKSDVKLYEGMKAYRSGLVTRIDVKPLSVNECWQGRRFKTPKYSAYEKALLLFLPDLVMPPAPYHVQYRFGFSNKLADLLNPEKAFSDILCKRYGIDDRHIFKMTLEKEIVLKGMEYIEFKIETLN